MPVAAGLLATALPAFGHFPALGAVGVSLQPWAALLGQPGLGRAAMLTVWTGCAATAASSFTAALLAFACTRPRAARLARSALPPALATPHAALAIGFAFLVAPSGWLARLVSPWLTGWRYPPDIATVGDPWGLALIAGLWLKEAPFLLLVLLAALGQAEPEAGLRAAAGLGHGPARAWALGVLPRAWAQVRLPVLAVLAFSCSAVDVALVLGPSEPPTLAVLALRRLTDPDLRSWLPGSAAALLLCAVAAGSAGSLLLAERIVARLGLALLRRGGRGGDGHGMRAAALLVGSLLASLVAAGIAALVAWSLAGAWRFPAALPAPWSLATWRAQAPLLARPALTTAVLGSAAAALAVLLAVAWLEEGRRRGASLGSAPLLAYAPLLVPQIGFMAGWQQVLILLRLDGSFLGLLWSHLVYALPYAVLALAEPWRALDPRYARAAGCLGAPPWRVLLRITVPLLARPLLVAGAVAFAVSAGLYLPTLFAGAGRWDTLTLEALALASGADRRVLGATALLQAALPLVAFALATAWPARRA